MRSWLSWNGKFKFVLAYLPALESDTRVEGYVIKESRVHEDGDKEEVAAQDAEEVVVGCGDHWGNVLIVVGFPLCIKEVVTNGARDDTLPVLLHEHIPAKNNTYVEIFIILLWSLGK
ncbi:hypothetical protein E2C01_001697 [Portunus trituberculatus]|uniref:Uncharacterized protein n=1 Tax=Portunus trituberculatus TaxID=210409 RepID=A0A5B7CK32_PORTR|nr:hypothetical protein [Portunus trituberculatus]